MSTQFPSSIISFSTKANGGVIDASHINSPQSEIEALETKVGVDSSADTTSLDYIIKNAASNGGGHVQTANKGGTGQTSYTKGDMLVASSSSVLGKLGVGANNTVLQADSSQTSGLKWSNVVAQKVNIQTTSILGTGSSANTYFTVPIPGSVLGTNNAVRFKAVFSKFGMHANGSTNVVVNYGVNSILSMDVTHSDAGSVIGAAYFDGVLVANGSESSQKAFGELVVIEPHTEAAGETNVRISKGMGLVYGTSSIASSADQDLVLKITSGGGGASSSILGQMIITEKIL